MDHSKIPKHKLTDKLVGDFQAELDRYTQMNFEQIKNITSDESMNLAKLGHGIPANMILSHKYCKVLLQNFRDIGGPYQLRKFIHCEQHFKNKNTYNSIISGILFSN